ncbi:hypothetical protein Tco_0143688 [Tanacetum coccineum]
MLSFITTHNLVPRQFLFDELRGYQSMELDRHARREGRRVGGDIRYQEYRIGDIDPLHDYVTNFVVWIGDTFRPNGDCERYEGVEVFKTFYACSDSLLLTPLCCDDIHEVTPRVSALAGCDKKQPAMMPKAKGLDVLSKSEVPDEQHLKTTSADKGTEEDKNDENDSEDKSDGNDDDDTNDDDNQEGDDTNDDDEETDSDRTESDRIKIHVLSQSTTEYYEEEEEENIDDEETIDDEEEDKVTKELYEDVNVKLGNEDTEMTVANQGASEQQNVSQESGFEQVEEDAHVTLTPVLDTQKADEPVQSSSVSSDFTSKLLNLENPSPADNEIALLMETSSHHAMTVPEITSGFTTTIPPPPPFFNPLPQQATPTPTPTTSEATTSFTSHPDFSSVFRFNDKVTNLEKDLLEIKQVDQYAQAPSFISAIILSQAVSDFATPVIEKNVIESLEAAVLARSSSQPKSTYEAAASLSEFELTKILLEKTEESKSHLRADYKKKLYDALFESYNTDKDLFNSYSEVFTLKRSRDDNDKDRDPFEKKSSSTSKDASQSQHKHSSKSAHVEEPSHTVDDSGVQQDQEFDTGNIDEQPADKERQHVDFRPPQTWISQVARAKEPRTSFDELMDTSFDFSAFVLNRLNIKDLTEEILVGPAFELLKDTCSMTTDKIVQIKERLKAARDRQKSYPDNRRKLLEFSIGDKVLLKVSPSKCVVRFGILDTFHVSNLKKCLADVNLHVPLEEVKIDDKLHFVEEPMEIMEREVKKLKKTRIPIVKVCWNYRRGP